MFLKLLPLLALGLTVMSVNAYAGVGPHEPGWLKVTPGENPMNLTQAVAAMGLAFHARS